jgi:TolB-like protein/DNA-binding winged helix-turn-helix (wHTH) protein/Tfp pilus assembly protein PilF
MRGGAEIALPKLSFDLLLVLIRDSPNLLSVDALIGKVWPGLVVSPETVSQRVKLLRDALGDDPKSPRYIAGLRGRGYQLIAPVALFSPAPPPEVPAEAPAPVVTHVALPSPRASSAWGRRWSPRARVVTALLILIGAVGGYAAYSFINTRARPANTVFAPPPHSVAVLAFVNMSGDPQQEYFAQGLAEELSNSLARIDELKVAARTSAFSFKGKDVDIPTVARKLNVGAVLEGSVRKVGDRVRITAQLINAITGFHLWSNTYDRDVNDVLRVQTEIARAVSGALKIELLADQQKLLGPGATRNVQAFDAYLRGRYGESIQDEAGLRGALAALEEAVALDPQYADALAFRADVMMQVAVMYVSDEKERNTLMAEARASVEKAIKLAPQSGLAYSTLGGVLSATSADYKAADAAYRRSVELEAGSAEILRQYASYAAAFGRADALTAARRAVNLDPLDLGAHANLGVALFYAHRFTEAAAAFKESTRLGNNRVTLNWMGLNELAAGHADAALQYCDHDRNSWADQGCLAMTYHLLGRHAEAAAMLEKMMASQGDNGAFQYAEIYAMWGESQRAMRWLERAVELMDGGLLAVKTDPFLDSIRTMPRFDELVAKVGLPET